MNNNCDGCYSILGIKNMESHSYFNVSAGYTHPGVKQTTGAPTKGDHGYIIWQCGLTVCEMPVNPLLLFLNIHQVPCVLNSGLSNNIRSYTLSINKQTVDQEYICTNDSEQCFYAWNVAEHTEVNYMVSVAANNVIGRSSTKNCTMTPIGKQANKTNVIHKICTLILHKSTLTSKQR